MRLVSPAFAKPTRSADRGNPAAPWYPIGGFTIVELIVAMLVLTIGILGMASVIASIHVRRLRVTSRIEMTTLAESKLEELRAYSTGGTADTVQLAIGGSITASLLNHSDTVSSGSGRAHVRRWALVNGPAATREVTLRIEPLNRARHMLPSLDFYTLLLLR